MPFRWKRSLTKRANSASLCSADLAQSTNTDNFRITGLRILVFGHESHLTVVIDEANPGKPLDEPPVC